MSGPRAPHAQSLAVLILLLSLPAATQDLDALFRDGMGAAEEAYAETDEDRRDALLDEAITTFRAMLVARPDLCACGSNSPTPSS